MPFIDTQNREVKALTGIHLYHFWLSSCSQRVRMVLDEKGLEWTGHEIDLERMEHATEEFQSINPKGLVPAMVVDGRVMIESIDIIDYLDTTYPEPPLRPSDKDDEAKMLKWMADADEAQHSLKLLTHEFLFKMHKMPPEALAHLVASHRNDELTEFMKVWASDDGFPRDEIDEELKIQHDCFVALDGALNGRQWLLGDRFTLADIAWVPNVHRLDLMDYPLDRHPSLLGWYARIKERPSYRAGVLNSEIPPAMEAFAAYCGQRRAEGTDVTRFGPLAA